MCGWWKSSSSTTPRWLLDVDLSLATAAQETRRLATGEEAAVLFVVLLVVVSVGLSFGLLVVVLLPVQPLAPDRPAVAAAAAAAAAAPAPAAPATGFLR